MSKVILIILTLVLKCDDLKIGQFFYINVKTTIYLFLYLHCRQQLLSFIPLWRRNWNKPLKRNAPNVSFTWLMKLWKLTLRFPDTLCLFIFRRSKERSKWVLFDVENKIFFFIRAFRTFKRAKCVENFIFSLLKHRKSFYVAAFESSLFFFPVGVKSIWSSAPIATLQPAGSSAWMAGLSWCS